MAVIQWIVAHQAILAALAVAVIDFIFALAPAVQSNGILHMVYMYLKGEAQPPVVPPAA